MNNEELKKEFEAEDYIPIESTVLFEMIKQSLEHSDNSARTAAHVVREAFKDVLESSIEKAREEERKKHRNYIELKLKQLLWSEEDINLFLNGLNEN